jgi:murein DD-endopeptidase MepM/ murein hydrolase activator NlpD
VDTTNPVITEANSPAAFEEYRAKIPPLFATYDEEIYWQGTFLNPVEGGRISTPFGAIRITNNDVANPRHHWGIDIAAPTGTPVIATNYGRVVLAEFLMHTGYTIVIEHGGGLKSYHFHMHTIDVTYNEMVDRGSHIGTVGSTGFSTGPHLHFEFRIGNQAINPLKLLYDTASIYL